MALMTPEKKDCSEKNDNKPVVTEWHSNKSRSKDTKENINKSVSGKLVSLNYRSSKDFKLRRRLIPPALKQPHKNYSSNLRNFQIPTGIPISTMTTYYPQYTPSYNYPVMDWSNLPVQNSVYGSPTVPIVIDPVPILSTNVICPYVNGFVPPVVLPTSIVPSTTIDETLSTYTYEEPPATTNYIYEPPTSYCMEPIASVELLDDRIYYELIGAQEPEVDPHKVNHQIMGLETYLKLPKDLFPSPRLLALDPNPLIDEFCKIKDIKSQVPWLLDLEFGIPKLPITRPIPTYNVKYNSIHCKNALDAIHPGFESCNQNFKTVFLFYYDCVVSTWYRGYTIMNSDRSVENFQSWLLLPMQALGMCWL